MDKPDYRIVLIGAKESGKSSLMQYIISGYFSKEYYSMNKTVYFSCDDIVKGKTFHFYNIAGWNNEEADIREYRDADLCLLFISVDNMGASEEQKEMFTRLCPDVPIMNVVTKCDTTMRRPNIICSLISLYNPDSVQQLFVAICDKLDLELNTNGFRNGRIVKKT